jgi:hypothetical protein
VKCSTSPNGKTLACQAVARDYYVVKMGCAATLFVMWGLGDIGHV